MKIIVVGSWSLPANRLKFLEGITLTNRKSMSVSMYNK